MSHLTQKQKFRILARTNPFEILDDDVLTRLASETRVRECAANTYLFRQGDASHEVLYVIGSGLAEIVVSDSKNSESVLALKRTYDFLGETVVLSGRRYPASVRVKETLTCCTVSKKSLERLIFEYPEFSSFFTALLTERIRMMYEDAAEREYLTTEAGSDAETAFFRRSVSEIMAYPVITCQTDAPVTDASRLMEEKDINAIVVLDQKGRPRGILTEKNLVSHLIARQRYPVETCRVEQVMRSDFYEIEPNAFVGQALVAMIRGNTRHLIVTERSEPVGIVNLFDLARAQSPGNLMLTRDIESQPDLRGLELISREIRAILRAMIVENAHISQILDVMSELRERLTRRVIQLSEEQMRKDGWGPPPVDYCWLNLGSAARYEQIFGTIQSNAIVFADAGENEGEKVSGETTVAYFRQFAIHVRSGLKTCDLGKADSSAVAADGDGCHSIREWQTIILKWVSSPTGRRTKRFFTLLDFRPVWGNMALAESLRTSLFEGFIDLIAHLRTDAGEPDTGDAPILFLGTFQTEVEGPYANQINLKAAAMEPLRHGVRMLATRFRISEPSTFGRIDQLLKNGCISQKNADRLRDSFETMMSIAVRENFKKYDAGHPVDYYVDPYGLRRRERIALKNALNASEMLREMVQEALQGE